ncbi:MAG: PilZ domain-containing protein [Acidobacteriia bacterium]|nr:PilZ domain-containing protein [Terriglobia bacterium]
MSPQSVPIQTPAADRRLHERLSVNFQVHLCWQDRQGNQILRARAVDISKFGLLVEAEKSIAPGTAISVQTNSMTLGTACVRHCTPKGLNYRIGLHMPDRMAGDLQIRRAACGGQTG